LPTKWLRSVEGIRWFLVFGDWLLVLVQFNKSAISNQQLAIVPTINIVFAKPKPDSIFGQ